MNQFWLFGQVGQRIYNHTSSYHSIIHHIILSFIHTLYIDLIYYFSQLFLSIQKYGYGWTNARAQRDTRTHQKTDSAH